MTFPPDYVSVLSEDEVPGCREATDGAARPTAVN